MFVLCTCIREGKGSKRRFGDNVQSEGRGKKGKSKSVRKVEVHVRTVSRVEGVVTGDG